MTAPARIPDIADTLRQQACAGDLRALDALLREVEPGVFALAMRMLGHPEDAREATQDVLVRVATHLASFRGEARFSTWVFRIARNVMLTYQTRAPEAPDVSFDLLSAKLADGRALTRSEGTALTDTAALSAEERAEAIDVARRCTQSFLMALGREERLAYLLDVVFGLDGPQAAEVLDIAPAAYRKRLSRARERLETAMASECGLINRSAPCRCPTQVHALRKTGQAAPTSSRSALPVLETPISFEALSELFSVVEVLRAQSRFATDHALPDAVRRVLQERGWLGASGP
ncbi:RNA polymerase sigma factor [Gemmatimonas sp.]|jgi:RNA polymerase sigma factor (sigma-70 family)|uniref:RNA polymerase sigma factor n=2 Tax=Gemmatimonas sp. TaxID=1962908 RepID=UPI0037BE58FB